MIVDSAELLCVSAEFFVQQLYVAHDHIKPSKADLQIVSDIVKNFPSIDKLNFEQVRQTLMDSLPDNVLKICGLGWRCDEPEPQINCEYCARTGLHAGGQIIASCCEEYW